MTLNLDPELGTLPVFVCKGAIVPIAPVVQSTEIAPSGPHTLLVHAGKQCAGELYQDGGKTYAYQRGDDLRVQFSYEMTADGTSLRIGSPESAHPAWWKELHIEIYGGMPTKEA